MVAQVTLNDDCSMKSLTKPQILLNLVVFFITCWKTWLGHETKVATMSPWEYLSTQSRRNSWYNLRRAGVQNSWSRANGTV